MGFGERVRELRKSKGLSQRALGMKVTAEGVETVEQQRFLKAAGCHYLQGFLYARPLAAEDLPDFLERFKPAPR